jgi:hypothetical protein
MIYIYIDDIMLDFLSIRLKELNKHHHQHHQLSCLNREVSGLQPFFRSGDDYEHFVRTSVDHTVNLEQGCVPTMIVTSNGDDDIVSIDEINQLMIQHMVGLDDDHHRIIISSDSDGISLESPKRMSTMSTVRSAMLLNSDKFNDVVYTWLETNM